MKDRKMPRQNAAAVLAEQICNEIQHRGLKEEDRFGTESDLIERYGVSRSVVRDAVARLQALGILTCRQRTGLLVGRVNAVEILRLSLPFTGTNHDDLFQVAQMRYALEVGAVELAARNASERQLELLLTMEAEYALGVRSEEPSITIAFKDAVFHGLILEMSGNPLLAGMHCVLEEHFRIWSEERERRRAGLGAEERRRHGEQSLWEHRMITGALCRRDAPQAQAFLREHLRAWHAPEPNNAAAERIRVP